MPIIEKPKQPDNGIDPVTGLTGTTKRPTISPIIQRSTPKLPGEYTYWNEGEFDTYAKNVVNGNVYSNEGLDRARAWGQPGVEKAFNAVVGGVASGVLTAVEDMAYIADFENNIKRILRTEQVESNVLSDLMKEAKKGLEKAMPIYREDPNKVFDWSDPGFYWGALRGVLDSAVGFAIPGMAASKVVGGVQRAMRTNQYLKMITGTRAGQQLTNSLASGFITNFGEGKMMALEQYENALKAYEGELLRDNYAHFKAQNTDNQLNEGTLMQMAKEATQRQLEEGKDEEFRRIAGEEANKFIARNRIFMITDALGLHGINRGKGFTRDILKRQGIGTTLKDFGRANLDNPLIQGVKEAGEEIGQNVFQMEGEYQTLKRLDVDSSSSPDKLADRIYEFALSDKALLEGMMGFFGGGPQRIFTQAVSGNYSKTARAERKARYNEQQEQIQKNKDFLNKKLGEYAQAEYLKGVAAEQGEDNLVEIIKKAEFIALAGDNLQRGTTEQLEHLLTDIENMTEEEAKANGYSDNYKQEAAQQKELLLNMERKYNSYTRYENQRDVFDNRLSRDLMQDEVTRLENLVMETENELELQENKNPDLQDRLKFYQRNLKKVNDHVATLDKEFKFLTSKETQEKERKRKQDQIKQAAENDKKVRDKAKKDRDKERAKRKKQNQEKKAAEESVKEEEKTFQEQAQEQSTTRKANVDEDLVEDINPLVDDELDVNEQEAYDPFEINDEGEVVEVSPEETDAIARRNEARDRFNKNSNDLLTELEDGAVTGQSRSQRLVGILENMIQDYKDSVEDDEVSFSEIIEALVDKYGTDRIGPHFGQLEAVYKLTEEGREYVPINDLESFRKLTEDEKKEIEERRRVQKQTTKVRAHTTETEKETEKRINELEKLVRKTDKKHKPDEGAVEVDYLRVQSGSGILAYLSRVYEQLFRKGGWSRRENSNELNKDIVNINVLDPTKFKAGTKVTLKLHDVGTQKVYKEGDFSKRTQDWQDKIDAWQAEVDAGRMTKAEMQERYNQQVPIAVYVGDEIIGFLHETEWINETNVLPENVQKDRERSIAIRNHIVATREFNTTITHRSTGYLFRANDGKHTLSDAMPDSNLRIVVGSKGEYKSNRNEVFTSDKLLNKEGPQEGVTHVIVPVGDDEIAIPLTRKKLGETPEVINTIMTAMEIFLFEKTDEDSKRIVKQIQDATTITDSEGNIIEQGFNINTAEGVTQFIEMFANSYDIGRYSDLKEFIKDQNLTSDFAGDSFFTMKQRGTDDVMFQIIRGTGVNHKYMSKKHLQKVDEATKQAFLGGMRAELAKQFSNTNLDQLGTDRDIILIRENGVTQTLSYKEHIRNTSTTPFLSHNIGTEEDPNYIYTIQPVIEMDFSEITGDEVDRTEIESIDGPIQVKAKEETEETKETPAEEKPRYKRGKRINLENLDDIEDAAQLGEQEDENQRFLRVLKEYSDPNISPERKAILEQELADMYYAEGEMVTFEEKSKIEKERRAERKRRLGESGSVVGLTEKQLTEMKERAEVRIDKKKKTLSGVMISQLGAARQQQIVEFLRGELVAELAKGERVDDSQIFGVLHAEFKSDLAEAEKGIETGLANGDDLLVAESEAMVREMNLILDNWDRIVGITRQQVERIESIKKVRSAVAEETEEEEEQTNNNEGWINNTYENNPADGLAPQIKYFLSDIGAYRIGENGEIVPDNNYLGLQRRMSYQEVYEILQRLTPNMTPDFETMLKKLEDIANDPEKRSTYPFLGEVVKKLRGASEQIKNQFVSGMTNHEVDMRFIMISRNKEGSIKLTEFQSNANAIAQVIEANWYSNLISGTAVAVLEEDGEYIIDSNTREELLNTYNNWIKDGVDQEKHANQMRQWLQQLGIIVSDETFRDLMNGHIYHNGRKWSLEDHVKYKGGLFKVLADNLRTRGNESLISGDKLISEGVVRSLAKHESEYAAYSHSNSHRTGNKTVYSYAQNKFLVNRVRQLKSFDEDVNPLLEQLSQLSFNGVSEWVTLLRENGGNNAFHKNFEHWLFSLEPLKKRGSKAKDNRELHKLSEADIEIAKIGMLQAAYSDKTGENNRVIKILYPTTSDKTTVMGLRVLAAKLILDNEGNITDTSINTIIDRVVRPEIARIRSIQSRTEEERVDLQSYNEGGQQFLFLPELNTIDGIFDKDGKLNQNIDDMMDVIRDKVKDYVNSLVEEKLEDWNENGITGQKDGNYLNADFMEGKVAKTAGKLTGKNPLSNVNTKDRIRGAATDMVFQYLIANAEIAMTMTGDPALYYKQAGVNRNQDGSSKAKFTQDGINTEYDWVADAEETYINIGKRLAADIAPGYEIADAHKDNYTQAFIADAPGSSENKLQLTLLLDGEEGYDLVSDKMRQLEKEEITSKQFFRAIKNLESAPYYAFDSSDAQEYTTWREHLHVMLKSGELTRKEHDDAVKAIEDSEKGIGEGLTVEQMRKVMQPMKPVYVDNIIQDGTDVERRMYIKSSSFPLLPQLTKGTYLNNLRVAMEEQGVDRIAYATSVKVGNLSKKTLEDNTIFDENGRIKPSDQIDFSNSTMRLNRRGFRIQQKVPEKAKAEINKVTQASKNLFINMLEVEGFKLPRAWFDSDKAWKEQEGYTGAELQKIYHDVYDRLHRLHLEKLKKEITIDGDLERIDKEKLRETLLAEAMDRGYPISDQELMHIDRELKFLPYSPSANKYEALLNSIVTNRVIRLKMPGKSYVLGSEEGFQTKLSQSEAEQKISGLEIVYTSTWTKNDRLMPMREENGKILPAQALVPWKFKDKRGKTIDMSKYVVERNGKKFIDLSRVSPEALNLFGMRIPNQGPNSQSWIEIVGFLPEKSGDLLIATKDYVVQMGSDFDVDKLYTYMYNTYEHVDEEKETSFLRVHRTEKTLDDEIKALQNKVIDIHIAIHKNTDQRVQGQIATPLGFWKLKDLAGEVEQMRRDRGREQSVSESGTVRRFTGLSDMYQRQKFKNASAGKSGVGVFSLDSMFNAVAQGKGLRFTVVNEEGEVEPLTMVFGNEVSDGDLSGEMALDGQTYKSDVIAGYQSGAVDNEKEQILDKLNINSHTFQAIKILNQLGFTEVVPLFIAQDIIVDYVKELERMSSISAGYQPNREEVAYRKVLQKYALPEGMTEDDFVEGIADEKATPEALRSYIRDGSKAANYIQAQRALLLKFIQLSEYGKKIQELQSTINPDSKGLGKSVLESLEKEKQVMNLLQGGSPIENATALIGDVVKISSAEERAQYEKEKWVIKSHGKFTYAIRPTTINGQAIAYGLFTNNTLWSKLFPYRKAGIVALMDHIESLAAGDNDVMLTAKVDRKHEIWKELKSYIFSDDRLGLHDTNITNERARLLYDQWEETEEVTPEGVFSAKRNTHKSLASIISAIKETSYGKSNPFISRLEVEVNKNGDPSLVKYRASAAEEVDETYIYTAIMRMLQSNKSLGEFNGKEYTAQELMQELILYSYITGGIQEAIQFVKYIPVAYLTSIPFANALATMSFYESDFGIIETKDEDKRKFIPPFVEQFIQHHPERVPQVVLEEVKLNHKNINLATELTLTEEGLARTGILTREGYKYRPYITIRGGYSQSGLKLFKYDGDKYIQIDTLGTLGASEYNRGNILTQRSLTKRNRSQVSLDNQPKAPGPNTATDLEQAELVEQGNTVAETIIAGKAKNGVVDLGESTSGTLLNQIVNSEGDPFLSLLASELLNYNDQFPSDLSLRIETDNDEGRAAKYNYDDREITIYRAEFGPDTASNTVPIVNRVLVHELLHGATGYKLIYYSDPSKRKAIENSIPGFKFTEKDEKAIKSIVTLMKMIVKKVESDPNTKQRFDKFKEDLAAKKRVSIESVNEFYGLTSVREFVAEALTNVDFQHMLNSIEAPSGKTFWQSLKDRILNLLRNMFPNITENSALAHVVYDVFDLMSDMEQRKESAKDVPPGTDDGLDVAGDEQGIDFSDMSVRGERPTASEIKRKIGLTSKLYSDKRVRNIRRKLGIYNTMNETSHRVTFKEATPTSYELDEFTLNFQPRNEEKKAERDRQRSEEGIISVTEAEQSLLEIRTREDLVAGETEADLGIFTDEGDFIAPSAFPATNVRRLGPKFQDYMAVKQRELDSLYSSLGRYISTRKKLQKELENTSDEDKINRLNAKRRALSKQIQRVKSTIENTKEKMREISELSALDQIEKYAEEDLRIVDKILNKKNITGKDIELARRLINVWQRAADFSGDEPHIFYDPEELEEAETTLKQQTDMFKQWGRRADEYNRKLTDVAEQYILSELEELFGDDDIDLESALPDIGFLTKNLVDVTEVDHILFQAVGKWVKDANWAAKQELDGMFEKLDDLIKATGLKEFSIFQQTFSNTDDRITGDLVYKFSQAYFDWSNGVQSARRSAIDRAKKRTDPEATGIEVLKANRRYVEQMRRNNILFDANVLFHDPEISQELPPSEEQKEKLISTLKNLLGEQLYQEYYNQAKRLVNDFKDDLQAQKDRFYAEFGEDSAEARRSIEAWTANNSPFATGDVMKKGFEEARYRTEDGKLDLRIFPTDDYTVHIPRAVDLDGNATGFYDDKFKQIEENESYKELYDYMFELLQELKLYLPNERINFMDINSIPTIKKKVVEQMSEGGVKGAFSRSKDAILEAVRMDDLSDIGSPEERKEFQLNMLTNNKKRINAYIELQDTKWRAEHDGQAPDYEQVVEWRKEIINVIAKEKSFDLGRVMKAFSAMAVTYKHKSAVEDNMRIAQDIVERALERRENAAGEELKDAHGNILTTKGLKNLRDMLDNFMDVAYWGYPSNRPEGKGKKKVLTQTEKELEELLNESLDDLSKLRADNRITEEEYNNRKEVINEQLKTLGGVKVASKFGDILLKYIQYKGMGWNVFAAFANMGFGVISNIIEASDGRNYSAKSFWRAQALVFNSVGKNVSFNLLETGNARKIRVLMNRFDVLKEAKNEIYKTTTTDKLFRRAGKKLEWLSPFNPQSRSEYFNQAPIMIAMMMDRKVTINGEQMSVWDAYNKDGDLENGIEITNLAVLKEQFETGKIDERTYKELVKLHEDLYELKNNIDQVVKMNHGNYDPDKPLAAKRQWIGRAITQFRTWALQGFAERFRSEFKDRNLYNQITNENFVRRKGRYRSYATYFTQKNGVMGPGGVFFLTHQLLRKLIGKRTQFDVLIDVEDGTFTEVDAANMRKNMTEIVLYIILASLMAGLKLSVDDDDDDPKKRLALNFLINQGARLATDIAFYTNPIEFERLARNAIPAFTLVTDGYKFITSVADLLGNGVEANRLQSGPNKGETKAWRDFKKIIPGPVQYEKLKSATSQIYKKQ